MKVRIPKSPIERRLWFAAYFAAMLGCDAIIGYVLKTAFTEGRIFLPCKYCHGYHYLATDPKKFYADATIWTLFLITTVAATVMGVVALVKTARSGSTPDFKRD